MHKQEQTEGNRKAQREPCSRTRFIEGMSKRIYADDAAGAANSAPNCAPLCLLDADPWRVFIDTEMRKFDVCAFIVRTAAPGADCPAPNISNYALGHAQGKAARVYTGVRALRDQTRLRQSGLMCSKQVSAIHECRLLVLVLGHDACTADGQTISVHLDEWLRAFALTQTKVLIFSPRPILILCMPVLQFGFVWDSKRHQHILTPAPDRLRTRHYVAKPWSAFCGLCQGAKVCPVHLRVPWQTVVNKLLVEGGPKAICIRGSLTSFNVHAYEQNMLEDNAKKVVLYRTVEGAKNDCFPSTERRKFLREVKLVIVNLPYYRDGYRLARVSKQTSTILRHLDSEFDSDTQFLLMVQRQPTLPQHWENAGVLSMDTRHDTQAQPPGIYLNYMVPSYNMAPGHEPVCDILPSDDDYDIATEEADSDFDEMQFELSDADSVIDNTGDDEQDVF